MKRSRKAKIVATLGPATSSPQAIEGLFLAGADVFRLNFSHGSHADHQARYDIIRGIEKRLGRPIGVLADLQGRVPGLHVVVTGRGAPESLMAAADLVTEMKEVKHPFQAGIMAQAGIEF